MTWSPSLTRVTCDPDLLDDAGALVAHDHGQARRPQPFDEVKVAATDAGRGHPDHHLMRVRLFNLDVLDDEGRLRLVQDRGFHAALSLALSAERQARQAAAASPPEPQMPARNAIAQPTIGTRSTT